MRTALLLLLACAAAGCFRSSSVPAMKPREWRAWTLPPDGATLPTPRSLAVGPRDELVTLDTAGRVLIYGADGKLLRQWKMLDVSVGKPEGVVILRDGTVIVCDTHYHRIVWFDGAGNWLRNIGHKGEGVAEFIYPVAICTDPQENLYICEYGGHDRVQKFTRDGKFLLEFASFGTGPAQIQRPSGIVWSAGRVYITDAVNDRIVVFSDSGKYIGILGADEQPLSFGMPYDIALDPDGSLLVIEYGTGRLSRVSTDGRLLGQLGKSGSGREEFATPWGVAVDSQRRIHVADTKNRRIVTLRL